MIRLVLVIVVYVVAPVAIFWWAVKRYRSGVKPDFTEVVAVVLSIVLIGLLSFTMWSTVTDEDRQDAQRIVRGLTERYAFPVKAKYQDKPAVFGDVEGRNIVVTIYGVTDAIEQQKIVAIARELRKQWDSKPIILKFYQKEIWEQDENGARRPAREKEMLIHKYHIE